MTTESWATEPPASVQQIVHVESGHGYGVIGADLHVFGDGTPLYVLENWHAPAAPGTEWLLELPSRMLNSRNAVVDFTGREAELEELRQWRQSSPRLAVRWLHGPGGQGKTRLGEQFAAQSLAEGWKVVTAIHGPGSVLPPLGSQDLRLAGHTGLLLVVDYADRWPLSHLTWLFGNALLHQPETPARVLLIARSADTWPSLRAALANHHASTSSRYLDSIPADDTDTRSRMFDVARDCFAARYGVSDLDVVEPSGLLEDPDFGLILALHMAALVAVDACVAERPVPKDMAGLTVYLLDREHLHWAHLYGDDTHELGARTGPFRTPPDVMNKVVFTAALTGALAHRTGCAVVAGLRLPLPVDHVIADHKVCYPTPDPQRDSVLEPLYPDRLAEDFLALSLPGHDADYPAPDWAPLTAADLLLRYSDRRIPSASLPRAVTLLLSAAARWPHVTRHYIRPWLSDEPTLAVAAGSAALSSLASLPDVDTELLEAVEACFPAGQHTDLNSGMALVTSAIATRRLAGCEDPAERARIRQRLALRLHNAGREDEGAVAAERAVGDWYRVAASDPDSAEPELVGALRILVGTLQSKGQAGKALPWARESVELCQKLADADPLRFSDLLAGALSQLGNSLVVARRYGEAVAVTRRAVELCRFLVARDPAHLPQLGDELISLASALSETGRKTEAVDASQEAVEIGRVAARVAPSRHEPFLSRNLLLHSDFLHRVGRHEESLASAEESVSICRRLAAVDETAFGVMLALALHGHGASLTQLGRPEEGLAVRAEAVAVFRRLATAKPGLQQGSGLAEALTGLATDLAKSGRTDEALAPALEALELHRQLVVGYPAERTPALASALRTHATLLWTLHRPEESTAALREAVEILGALDSTAHEKELAKALHVLGRQLSILGGPGQAIATLEAATRLHRTLADRDPAAHEPGLIQCLTDLGECFAGVGRSEDALVGLRTAADLSRRSATMNPLLSTRAVASLGIALSQVGRHEEALALAIEARELVDAVASADDPDVSAESARVLTALGNALTHAGHPEQAIGVTREAVSIYRRLASADATVEHQLAIALNNLAAHLHKAGQPADAVAATRQTVELYHRLTTAVPATPEHRLASVLGNLGFYLNEVGRRPEALAVTREATQLCRRSAAGESGDTAQALAHLLCQLRDLTWNAGNVEEALDCAEEAVGVYRNLALFSGGSFRRRLANELRVFSTLLHWAENYAEKTMQRTLPATPGE